MFRIRVKVKQTEVEVEGSENQFCGHLTTNAKDLIETITKSQKKIEEEELNDSE